MVSWSTVLSVFKVIYKLHCFTVHIQANSKWADGEQEWGTKGTEKLLKTKIISCEHWI